jgi:medium-chain acyl-[acyl-carrier-protein] hydrolase
MIADPAGRPRDRWVVTPRPNPGRRLRLFCFPYAGGGTSLFRPWVGGLPPGVELCAVQLPGREARLAEAPYDRVGPLVDALGEGLERLCQGPFVFFGHSMGALVAFELVRWRRARGLPPPLHLFVSGRAAPQVPRVRRFHELPDSAFLDRLRHLNGTPQEVLGDGALMRRLLPLLRADFAVNDAYEHRPEPPLDCPITAFGGLDDLDVGWEDLEAWREQTCGAFGLRLFPGSHFFLHEAREELLRALSEEMGGIAAART